MKVYEFTNNTGSSVIVLHIEFNCKVDVQTIDGKSPSDPIPPYDLSGNHSEKIDIDFTRIGGKQSDAKVVLKIIANSLEMPKIKEAVWTLPKGGGVREIDKRWLKEKGYS